MAKTEFLVDTDVLRPLAVEWASASDLRNQTLTQCRIAFDAIGHLEGEPRNQTAIAFADLASVATAAVTYASDPALAERMAGISVQQGGQKISHTTVLQRSMAYALASVAGTPTPDSIMIAKRLADVTKKGAAAEKTAMLGRTDIDEAGFSAAIDEALERVTALNAKTPANPQVPAGVEFNVSILLDALTWASKNPDAFKSDDVSDEMRAMLTAGARDVIKFTK